jgi:hypothetical protein
MMKLRVSLLAIAFFAFAGVFSMSSTFADDGREQAAGAMGTPLKVMIEGKPVFLCCDGCTKKAQANPAAVLAKVEELKKAGTVKGHGDGHDHQHTDKKE